MQGRNLWPLLTGGTLPSEPALLELLVDRNDVRALREVQTKVIDWRGESAATYGFQLVRDRFEKDPIGVDQPWVAQGKAGLQQALERNRELRTELYAPPEPLQLSPELDWRLHQYGYTEGEPRKHK
jgi:hypothetical protein